jgi:hypothetical protein
MHPGIFIQTGGAIRFSLFAGQLSEFGNRPKPIASPLRSVMSPLVILEKGPSAREEPTLRKMPTVPPALQGKIHSLPWTQERGLNA